MAKNGTRTDSAGTRANSAGKDSPSAGTRTGSAGTRTGSANGDNPSAGKDSAGKDSAGKDSAGKGSTDGSTDAGGTGRGSAGKDSDSTDSTPSGSADSSPVVEKRRRGEALSAVDDSGDSRHISRCMLLSSALLCVPATLLALRRKRVASLAYGLTTAASLIYHRHFLETRGTPNTVVQSADLAQVLFSTAVILRSGNRPTLAACAAGIASILVSQMYNDSIGSEVLVGGAGLHSLGHVLAGASGVLHALSVGRVVTAPTADDLHAAGLASLGGIVLFALFQPRPHMAAFDTRDLKRDMLGARGARSTRSKTILAAIQQALVERDRLSSLSAALDNLRRQLASDVERVGRGLRRK